MPSNVRNVETSLKPILIWSIANNINHSHGDVILTHLACPSPAEHCHSSPFDARGSALYGCNPHIMLLVVGKKVVLD